MPVINNPAETKSYYVNIARDLADKIDMVMEAGLTRDEMFNYFVEFTFSQRSPRDVAKELMDRRVAQIEETRKKRGEK